MGKQGSKGADLQIPPGQVLPFKDRPPAWPGLSTHMNAYLGNQPGVWIELMFRFLFVCGTVEGTRDFCMLGRYSPLSYQQ